MPEPETPDEERSRHLRELEGKNVQHYSVLLSAWIQTRMERDKTVVALSAAAIGLSVTLLTTVGVPNLWLLLPYAGSFLGFSISIGAALLIYQRNSEKIEHDIRGDRSPPNLEPYDRAAISGFLLGAVSLASIGIASATLTYFDARTLMADSKKETTAAPKPGGIRSLQGLEALKPASPATAPASPEAQPSAPAPAAEPPAAEPASPDAGKSE